MRYRRYPSRGRPPALTEALDELVMLLQASIEIANAERWALEIGDLPVPANLQQSMRRSAYEVTVVDALHRIARRYFDQHGYRAVWERAFQTGRRGRPESIDISLFNTAAQQEIRLELGLYSKSKLREDARKLARLTPTVFVGHGTVQNLLMLWEINEETLTMDTARAAMAEFKADSKALVKEDGTYLVTPLLASSVDLFVAKSGASRHATVGLFSLIAPAP
jgi:hypothetical protein